MSDQPRPVWLTERQAVSLIHCGSGFGDTCREIWRQYEAAPADARAEIIKALATGRTIDYHIWFRGDAADGVLRALGMPDA